MSYENLLVSAAQAEILIKELFGLTGIATPLPGEIDCNFRITVSDTEVYTLKISRPDEKVSYLDFQQRLVEYAWRHRGDLVLPRYVAARDGSYIQRYTDCQGRERFVRLLTWIPGRPWHRVHPHSESLLYSLGNKCGLLTAALQGFTDPAANRELHWDIAQGLWIRKFLPLLKGKKKELVGYCLQLFEAAQASYACLRTAVVHNDANDHNILVSEDLREPKVRTLIDFGDAVHTQVINDVAVACAYAVMQKKDPLQACMPIVKGYHAAFHLEEAELGHLYITIAMRLAISVTKSAVNLREEPENKYLQVSDAAAWKLLKAWRTIHPDFAHFTFRHACGLNPHPFAELFESWAQGVRFNIRNLFPTQENKRIIPLDLSVSSTWIGHLDECNDLEQFQFKIDAHQKRNPGTILAGGYLEARPLYTTSEYVKTGDQGQENRTIHLGVDFWLPGNTPVLALLEGVVCIAVNDAGNKEYGGLVVLRHQVGELVFYSLYGHLSVASATSHQVGDILKAGDRIGLLGSPPENGNWSPHLHFQLLLSLFDYQLDFPGVTYPRQADIWESICPDPNLLFGLDGLKPPEPHPDKELLDFRKQYLGKSLSLQYEHPLHIVRGSGTYLIDGKGRKYLDMVNNVAHVGHEHPDVVRAGQQQMAVLNTNTRYLHKNIRELTEELLETLPPELCVLHFVNSGSEANELALRMVKAATGQQDFLASEAGYHGNTNLCVEISSYKFDGKGGKGAPAYTHIFPLPDAFRGKYRGILAAAAYAGEVQKQIEKVQEKGSGVAALILEPIISCGGQIELPEGFLEAAYKYVRAADGLCISDEVQVGCGRVGKTFWGFQLYGVLPDIVTIGKPLGNGHPLAAVACTKSVADAFANGMEYFNTFGGNPVSCAIGTEVLRVVKREKLQENALKTGNYLKEQLTSLASVHPILGDVRGQGLFLGLELVDALMNPLAQHADYLVNRMKDYGILMSTDGPARNVLKIKPPMIFNKQQAEHLLYYLGKVLDEDFMKSY